MKNVLHLISSPQGERSYSLKLSRAIINKLESAYPGVKVTDHDLTKTNYPHLEETHITSFFTPDEYRQDSHREAIRHSDTACKELLESDALVIGVPMYNFGIPSSLKAWVDHVCRKDITFRYVDGQPVGCVPNKKVYLAISSGGIYSEGPYKAYDHTESYLRSILGFLGITDVTAFRVEGTNIPPLAESAVTDAMNRVSSYTF